MLGLVRVFGFFLLVLSLAGADQIANSTAAQPIPPIQNQSGSTLPSQPAVAQPAVPQPAVNQPAVNQPAVNQPNQPAANQPAGAQPNQPAVNQPARGQPATNQPLQPGAQGRQRELERERGANQPVQPIQPGMNHSAGAQPLQPAVNQTQPIQPAQPAVNQPAGAQPNQPAGDVRIQSDFDDDDDDDDDMMLDINKWDFNITRFLTKELNKTLGHLFKMCKKLHNVTQTNQSSLSDKPEGERSLLMGVDWLCQLNFNATSQFMGLGFENKMESAGGDSIIKKNFTQENVQETLSIFHRRRGCDRGCRQQCRRHWEGIHRRRSCWCNCHGRRTASWEA